MKDNKDLHPFAGKKLASLDVVFENCEVYNIPADGIYKLSIEDIKHSFDVHVNGLNKFENVGELYTHSYTDFVWLALNEKGMNTQSGWADMFDDSELFKDRVKHNDITHLDFIFDDGSELSVGVPWEDGETEWTNALQKTDIRNNILFINIDANRVMKDEKLKDINDEHENCHNWDLENEEDIEVLDLTDNDEKDNSHWIDLPNYVQAAFRLIDEELYRVMWNINQEEFESPFDNTGNSFKNDVFEVEAYSWDDEYDQKYNFKWGDYEVRWYKHSRRDPQENREISPEECSKMLEECLKSIREMDIDDLFEEEVHTCVQCGRTDNCKPLKNGKYACSCCLNNLGKEQKELKEEIENNLFDFGFDNYEEVTDCIETFIDFLKFAKTHSTIDSLDHLINSLNAINIVLKGENGLLDDETAKKIKEFAENW